MVEGKKKVGWEWPVEVKRALDELVALHPKRGGNKARATIAGLSMLYSADFLTRQRLLQEVAAAEVSGDWSKLFPRQRERKAAAKTLGRKTHGLKAPEEHQ